jgi:hypothetical protein
MVSDVTSAAVEMLTEHIQYCIYSVWPSPILLKKKKKVFLKLTSISWNNGRNSSCKA